MMGSYSIRQGKCSPVRELPSLQEIRDQDDGINVMPIGLIRFQLITTNVLTTQLSLKTGGCFAEVVQPDQRSDPGLRTGKRHGTWHDRQQHRGNCRNIEQVGE